MPEAFTVSVTHINAMGKVAGASVRRTSATRRDIQADRIGKVRSRNGGTRDAAHHGEYHSIGQVIFQRNYNVDLEALADAFMDHSPWADEIREWRREHGE